MTSNLQRVVEGKRAYRRKLASLPSEKKLQLLEALRSRGEVQRGKRRSASSQPPPKRFGGRATAGGVNYEVRVAALIGVKMLAGNRCAIWDGISGDDVLAITLQAAESVDDIVVTIRGAAESCVFISAKERGSPIPLTAKSAAFTDTVDAFVRQFLKISATADTKSRLVWAVTSSAGRTITQELADVLNTHRLDAGESSISEFLQARQPGKRKAMESLVASAKRAWKTQTGNLPMDDECRGFLRRLYVETYDFGHGQHCERQAEGDIRSHVVAHPEDARRVWKALEHFFGGADQRGIVVTPASLRRLLVADGFTLKFPPDYAEDITQLRELTARNLARLKEHASLPFGPKPDDVFHIPRIEELNALIAAVSTGHLLITGEPGSGKSGLIHDCVGALQEGAPVVLLLAEEVFGRDWKGAANLPGFDHPLNEALENWPSGNRGVLFTDALDAVRDIETQKLLRNLLRDVQTGKSGWTVVASVREFDLKHGRELCEAFPGSGVAGYASNDFASVSHFHLPRLTEAQLDKLCVHRSEIRPFIESARKSAKSENIHRSPFYLRLAAELLRANVTPSRLADWNSPAVLMRRFWEARVQEGEGADEREVALRSICQQMVDSRSMSVSATELSLRAPERKAVRELRSRGILRSPARRDGTHVGEDEIRFAHHLLHDYAIARSLIPKTQTTFCDFTTRHRLLPIFYRQSFMFALEELWDADATREEFWKSALKLEGVAHLHGITRILAPILAARRVESLADLQPLLTAVAASNEASSPSQKALRHLASGFQDSDLDAIRAGAIDWCAFAERLAAMLPSISSVEQPLANIITRLNTVDVANEARQSLALNAAARGLMAAHLAREASGGRTYSAMVATEALCRTFGVAPSETENVLLSLLSPERIARFPRFDLIDLAHQIKHLGESGDVVVIRLFEAAFSTEPAPGEWENFGGAIMSMRMQTSDNWHSIHFSLAEYYKARAGQNAGLMTEIACIAWNAAVRRRSGRRNRDERILGTIQFRGVLCELIEDYSHIWGREFEREENRILSHFEKLLGEWAAAGDVARLNDALDRFAVRNRTSLIWTVFLEAGAEFPSTLGVLLENVLHEPLLLTHPDYAYAGAALLGALHKVGGLTQRERLESLILHLPQHVHLREGDSREPMPSWVEHAQNRLLGVLEEANIVTSVLDNLRRERKAANPLPVNKKRERHSGEFVQISDAEEMARRGVSLNDSANKEMLRLREALKPLSKTDKNTSDADEVERRWSVIQECELALKRYKRGSPKMAEELWGHLVGACASIASHVTSWPKTSKRWKAIRRVLLRAAHDRSPEGNEESERDEGWPSWGWPAPRIDAASGLPFLVHRLGKVDREVAAALRRLCRDKSHALRFNLADRLAVLEQPAPELMWEIMDTIIANERKFSVLDALLLALDRLWAKAPGKVKERLRLIADRTMKDAPDANHIHETLAHIMLFQFLRTGDADCEAFVANLVAECDSARASDALLPQLHGCREGGWMTAGDSLKPDAYADAARARTWKFLSDLLTTAQAKLQQHRESWRQLHAHGQPDADTLNRTREKLDRAAHLVDGIAMQLYFASGAFYEKSNNDKERLSQVQLQRFWTEAFPLFSALTAEPHPHTVHQIVETLYRLLPCSPREVFLLATQSIRKSATEAGYQYDPLAVGDVVKLIQRALADHRDIFQADHGQESECLAALLQVLDLFVEAGWAEARQLTHRLEEIYR